MRNLFVFFLIACTSNLVFCQEDENEMDDSLNISGYISPFLQTTHMVHNAYFVGGTGAIFIDHNFFLGGFGMTMSNYYKTDRGKYSGNELDIGGGGLVLGYVFYHEKKIHPVITLWGGGGSLSLSDKDKVRNKDAYDDFLWMNGTVEIEYKPFNFIALGAGVHYQIISGLVLDGYSEKDFSGPGFYFNIKVGIL